MRRALAWFGVALVSGVPACISTPTTPKGWEQKAKSWVGRAQNAEPTPPVPALPMPAAAPQTTAPIPEPAPPVVALSPAPLAAPPANADLVQKLADWQSQLGKVPLAQADPKQLANWLADVNVSLAPVRQRAELRANTVCLCRRVRQLGDYDPWPSGQPVQPGELIEFYLELDHFTTTTEPGPFYVVQLAGAFTLRSSAGEIVWQAPFEQTDRSRSQRRDLLVRYRLGMPAVPAGTYAWGVQLVERPTGRSLNQTVEVRVANGP